MAKYMIKRNKDNKFELLEMSQLGSSHCTDTGGTFEYMSDALMSLVRGSWQRFQVMFQDDDVMIVDCTMIKEYDSKS